MSRGLIPGLPAVLSFPRVSGDEPNFSRAFKGLAKFSPRERG